MSLLKNCSENHLSEQQTKVVLVGKCLKRLSKLIPKNAPDFGDPEVASEWISELLSINEVNITETCRKCKLSYSEFPTLAKFLQECGVYCHPEAAIAGITRNIIDWLNNRSMLSEIATNVVESVGGRRYFNDFDLTRIYDLTNTISGIVRSFNPPLVTPQQIASVEIAAEKPLYCAEDSVGAL